jgi:hypothetical protein
VYGKSDATGCLDLLAIVVESPANDRFGSVLVCGSGRGRKGIGNGVIELFIVGPVWTAEKSVSLDSRLRLEVRRTNRLKRTAEGVRYVTGFGGLTLLLWTYSWCYSV